MHLLDGVLTRLFFPLYSRCAVFTMRAVHTTCSLFCLKALCAAMLLSACGKNDARLMPDGSHMSATNQGLILGQPISVDGVLRQFHLYVPMEAHAAPIVFLLHGHTGSANQIIGLNNLPAPFKQWLDIAEREQITLIIPDGAKGPEGTQGWNDCRTDAPTNPSTDDVAFLSAVRAKVIDELEVVNPRTFATGISNGGFMTMRLAEENPFALDAIAVIVSSRPVNSACADSNTPLSVLFMNGTDDPITPYGGGRIKGDRGEVASTNDTVNYWVTRNQTSSNAQMVEYPDIDPNDNSLVRRYSYSDGLSNSVVEHYEVVGGGHVEPSRTERFGALYKLIVGGQNNDIEMTDEVWAFFKARL